MLFGNKSHLSEPRVDHRSVKSLQLYGITDHRECFHEIVLRFAEIQTFKQFFIKEDFLLILESNHWLLLFAFHSLVQFSLYIDLFELLCDLLKILNGDTLQSQSLLMVLSCDRTDTDSLGSIILIESLWVNTFRNRNNLIHEPNGSDSHIFDEVPHHSLAEAIGHGFVFFSQVNATFLLEFLKSQIHFF